MNGYGIKEDLFPKKRAYNMAEVPGLKPTTPIQVHHDHKAMDKPLFISNTKLKCVIVEVTVIV